MLLDWTFILDHFRGRGKKRVGEHMYAVGSVFGMSDQLSWKWGKENRGNIDLSSPVFGSQTI
tara:strand:+ start:4269 stop:4454 length:186 start_codon:yes stop_codon:yes gene_type:complete